MTRTNGALVGEPVVAGHGPGGVTYVVAPEGEEPGAPLAVLLESVLFVAAEPVALGDLARVLGVERRALDAVLAELAAAAGGRGVRLQRTGGRVQLVSAPEAAEAVERFLGLEASSRLSRAALEVLSIIAYRQPATRPEVDDIRGVASDAALRTLLARGLVEVVGRRETVGHPVEYGTTFHFLEYFGLESLEDLPAAAFDTGATPVATAEDGAQDRELAGEADRDGAEGDGGG